GGRLTTRSVSGIVKQALRNIGLDSERYTAHSLRHTSVTYALMAGATVEEAQKMARHADISTTMLYAHHVDRVRNNAEARVSSFLDEALED
ncbi:MAG: tyrosine-type recombinase/integrase, partial [Eggerthellaceae bacterium]|nr:tyrosine-type recombinase/integrase [Eggerthellaceae bacterium]